MEEGFSMAAFYKKSIAGGFWQINKTLAKFLGCTQSALVLDELIFHEIKHANSEGWFYYPTELLEENCLISKRTRQNIFDNLKSKNLITIEKRDSPAKFFYRIDHDALDAIFVSVPTSGLDLLPLVGDICSHSLYKEKDIINKVVVEGASGSTGTTPATTQFSLFKDYFMKTPYYSRLKAHGAILAVYKYYLDLKVFKLAYDDLWASYEHENRFDSKFNDEEMEAWQKDCHSFIENSILKNIK